MFFIYQVRRFVNAGNTVVIELKGSRANKSPFHLVEPRPWPLFCAVGAFGLVSGGVLYFRFKKRALICSSLLLVILGSVFWWADVIKERQTGFHTRKVVKGLQLGMLLFILSEVLFFFSFFWAYFHSCWGVTPGLGYFWPPFGFNGIIVDPYGIPLLKTVILLSSGATVTWAHYRLLSNLHKETEIAIFLTCLLGFIFLGFQMNEYIKRRFSLRSLVYGSVFYMLTGFHGFHVTIGSIFLLVCFFRQIFSQFNSLVHVGFEAAAWYWHFVDVVWLFLFICLYWYGSF